MKATQTYKNYLRDLIYLLKDKLNSQQVDNDFDSGIKFELKNTIDLIQSQANAFGLDLNEIGFYDFEKYQEKSKGEPKKFTN